MFTYAQLYVALSRIKSKYELKILILENDPKLSNKTSNIEVSTYSSTF